MMLFILWVFILSLDAIACVFREIEMSLPRRDYPPSRFLLDLDMPIL